MGSLNAACLSDLPAPGASCHAMLGYLDRHATVIDGHAYGDCHAGCQRFLKAAEPQYWQTGDVGADLHRVLALISLVCRRHRHSEAELADVDVHRSFVQVLLRKARALLRGPRAGTE